MSKVCLRPLVAGRFVVAILLALGLTTLMTTGTASQDGEAPPPWDCGVEPVDLLSLLEIVNELDQVSDTAALQPVDAGFIAPGEPVRSEDQVGIEQAAWELAACVNAQDPLRVAALFTPDFQASIIVALISGEGVQSLAEQIPVIAGQVDPDQEVPAIPITAAWYSAFSSHEIEAVLSPIVEGLEEQREFLVRFVYSDGRWLIDEMRLISGSATGSGETTGAATPAASPTAADSGTVVSYDIYFEPDEVTIAADTSETIVLPNEGAAPHNFSIDELGVDITIEPGASGEVVINAPAGEYEFYCDIPGHREAGMVGTLIVE